MTFPYRRARMLFLAAGLLVVGGVVAAADPAKSASLTPGDERLFNAFAEDATIVPNQWWEAQVDYASYSHGSLATIDLIGALRPVERLELGGRVGFGSSSADGNLPDGSGATDLDLWGKWRLGAAGAKAEFAVGGLVTVPTGDDTAGLGHDAFDFEGFGSMRYRLPEAILTGYLGFRFNGNGQIQGYEIDGKTSTLVGGGVIYPLSDHVGLVGEINVESERWNGFDSDVRALAGVNWRPLNRGVVRAALTFGLTEGAPDARVVVGYAYTF